MIGARCLAGLAGVAVFDVNATRIGLVVAARVLHRIRRCVECGRAEGCLLNIIQCLLLPISAAVVVPADACCGCGGAVIGCQCRISAAMAPCCIANCFTSRSFRSSAFLEIAVVASLLAADCSSISLRSLPEYLRCCAYSCQGPANKELTLGYSGCRNDPIPNPQARPELKLQ